MQIHHTAAREMCESMGGFSSQPIALLWKRIETTLSLFKHTWHIFKSNTNLHFLHSNGTRDFLFVHKFFTSFFRVRSKKLFCSLLPCLSFILNSNSIISLSISQCLIKNHCAEYFIYTLSRPAGFENSIQVRLIMLHNFHCCECSPSEFEADPCPLYRTKFRILKQKQISHFHIPTNAIEPHGFSIFNNFISVSHYSTRENSHPLNPTELTGKISTLIPFSDSYL